MNKRRTPSAQANSRWVVPAACLATILALPVHAGITMPDEPLTTANRVAPNILFILDDSGSMAWRYMYNQQITEISGGDIDSGPTGDNRTNNSSYDSASTNRNAVYDQTYVTNTLYYNPAVTYQPWMGPDGNRLSGGTSYTSAYDSNTYITNSGAGTSGGSIDLSDNTQTFYVPKDVNRTDAAYLSNVANYYRYQILTDLSVKRAEFGTVVTSWTTAPGLPGAQSAISGGMRNVYSFNLPSGVTQLEVTLSGNDPTGSGADLYVRRGNWPSTSTYDCRSNGSSNNERCDANNDGDLSNPQSGMWYIGINRASNYSNVILSVRYATTNRCGSGSGSTDWVNCTDATPTGRSEADERTNFATWYSYFRTRSKAAKGGAADAFRPIGAKARVGFRTIWNRNDFDIPVTDGNDGRFVDNIDDPNTPSNESTTTRTTWYRRLYAAQASNGTPLQSALDSAGQYFSSTASTGPYGPQATASQYSCRQNFTILTTDGYWNSGTVDVGNADNTNGTQITGPNNQSYTYTAANPYKDSYSQTLADIAMYYWKRDLRTQTNMVNNVPTTSSDPAFWQHMVTFGISIGLSGKKGWQDIGDVPANPSWADPTDTEDADRIDDLLHAALNGRGAFVSAANPSEFTAGLNAALATISQRTSSFSNVATNAASVRTGGKVFSASYVSGLWTGAMKAWTLDANNNPSALAWSASVPGVATRKVYTFDGSSGQQFPTSTQIATLTRTGGPVDYPVTGSANASYLKGDASNEERNGGLLRNRTSVLGDIVGSSPAYVDDTATLYVGANDGMLHAFDATNGQELFAYVPSIINMAYLRDLSRGDYTHKFFVDGPVVVTSRKLTPGKNLLVGALGKGGRGLYGLDVSSPATFAGSSVKWELAQTPANNMGLVTGRPVLAKVKTGAVAAILGNGVNSPNDKAVLIVVNAETGAVIGEVDTGVGSSSTPNGLAAPTAVLGPDGKTVSYAYAGDRLGNVWRFDLTSASPGGWTATRLFTAKSNDGSGAAQPITGAVTVATEPSTFKRWVFLGTGSFMTTTEADDKTPLAQSMYGFIDDGSANPVAYSDLVKRTIGNTGASQDGYPVRTFEAKASLPANKKGWFVNLPGNGERVVQDAQVVANILVTASMIPEGDACEASGTGYINALDAFTGTSAGSSFFDLDGDGKTDDTMVGGVPVGSVNFGVGMPTLPIFLDGKLVVGGTGGSVSAEKPGAGGITRKSWGRVSWRELRSD